MESVQLRIPLTRQGFALWLQRVEDRLECEVVGHEVGVDAFQGGQGACHRNELLGGFIPSEVIKPLSRVRSDCDFT